MEASSPAERCYRHPGVETRVSCSNCGRPICPDCFRPAPVGQHCPECAGDRQTVRTASSVFGGGADRTPATFLFLGVNVAVFFIGMATGSGVGTEVDAGLTRDGGLFGPAIADGGEWWRIITAGFLHAGFLHLLLNMFALYVLGTLLEPAIGTARFVGIYVVSMLAGSAGALLLDPNALTVGASGAIYGLLAAAFFIARQRESQVASEIGLWLILNLVFTFSISGISIGGHLGGLIGGALGAFALIGIERARPREANLIEGAAFVVLGALAIAGALAAAGQATTQAATPL